MTYKICKKCLHHLDAHYRKGLIEYCSVCDGHGKACLTEIGHA